MDKSRRFVLQRVNRFPRSCFDATVGSPRKRRLPFPFKHGRNIDICGGFRVSSARAPYRSPTSGPGQADRNTHGVPGYTVTSEYRRKLGRNLSAGVPSQDVVNAATLTHTKDDY